MMNNAQCYDWFHGLDSEPMPDAKPDISPENLKRIRESRKPGIESEPRRHDYGDGLDGIRSALYTIGDSTPKVDEAVDPDLADAPRGRAVYSEGATQRWYIRTGRLEAFLRRTEKAWHGPTFRGIDNPYYQVISMYDTDRGESIGETDTSVSDYRRDIVNRGARMHEAHERFISRTIDRAEQRGISITPAAIVAIVAKISKGA